MTTQKKAYIFDEGQLRRHSERIKPALAQLGYELQPPVYGTHIEELCGALAQDPQNTLLLIEPQITRNVPAALGKAKELNVPTVAIHHAVAGSISASALENFPKATLFQWGREKLPYNPNNPNYFTAQVPMESPGFPVEEFLRAVNKAIINTAPRHPGPKSEAVAGQRTLFSRGKSCCAQKPT